MAVGSISRARFVAQGMAGVALALAALPSAALAVGVPTYAESPVDALSRNVRLLAESPKSFTALVGAGKAALDLGDAQSAAGFFGRAEEVHPASPIPKAGMGAALVMTGDPAAALTYFAQAQQLGASVASFGCERGLGYDLMGNHVAAQADYRAALSGLDRDEARRRLALSLAIGGNKAQAIETLQPLLQRGDRGAGRVHALVLALGGDFASARSALDRSMPGASARMDPFFRRLPSLSSVQKAAAVHLGVFPDSGMAMASASPAQSGAREDRLASIDQLLQQGQPAADQTSLSRYAQPTPAPAVARQVPPRIQLASVPRKAIERTASSGTELETKRIASSPGGRKIWLQLASGSDADELPHDFRRMRSREPSLFSGISGFVANAGDRTRLLIGPFHSDEDARLFADALQTVRISASRWVSQPGQVVSKLPNQ